MNLKEFREKYKENDNIFWTLETGEIQNLLEEAIEVVETYESRIINKLEERLKQFEKQLTSNYGFANKMKIQHKVKELKKCIQIIKSIKNTPN